jgi:DNA (cytosine-5)-methyltransferase 1
VRRLTGREMLRLQGFPENFIINVPYTQIRKIAGNSVTVPVIRAIAGEVIKSMESRISNKKKYQMSLFGEEYEFERSKSIAR